MHFDESSVIRGLIDFKILEKWANPPLSVLDNRAASYEKLNDLTKALKDAREMIVQEKADVSVSFNVDH